MRIFIWILLVCCAVFLEVSIVPIPFSLITLLYMCIISEEPLVFFVAIFAGILLDSLFFQTLGLRSVFFLVTLGLVFLYGRKFEVKNTLFIFGATIVSSFAYFLLFGYQNLFGQLIATGGIVLVGLASIALIRKIQARMVY
ncbi:MAG TPA: hypothetical protein VLB73_03815 [Patescibacteria group bacterium]|nr:hypothetical protein [Patescibacteria group bacterium]